MFLTVVHTDQAGTPIFSAQIGRMGLWKSGFLLPRIIFKRFKNWGACLALRPSRFITGGGQLTKLFTALGTGIIFISNDTIMEIGVRAGGHFQSLESSEP